jgi:hypothetical protein
MIAMAGTTSFALEPLDYAAPLVYFVVLCAIGLWAGRKEKSESGDYFLAGKTLPWYVVGDKLKEQADKGYVRMPQDLIPAW